MSVLIAAQQEPLSLFDFVSALGGDETPVLSAGLIHAECDVLQVRPLSDSLPFEVLASFLDLPADLHHDLCHLVHALPELVRQCLDLVMQCLEQLFFVLTK